MIIGGEQVGLKAAKQRSFNVTADWNQALTEQVIQVDLTSTSRPGLGIHSLSADAEDIASAEAQLGLQTEGQSLVVRMYIANSEAWNGRNRCA